MAKMLPLLKEMAKILPPLQKWPKISSYQKRTAPTAKNVTTYKRWHFEISYT